MILCPCTSKLILSIFFRGPFVFAQFWDITLIISWSVKKLIFLMKILKMADFVSVISPWKPSPRSKFGGQKRTSRTSQEDGRRKKWEKKYLRGEFCGTKSCFFCFFEIFQNWQFWSKNFAVKTAPTEKMEYTIMTATENPRNLSFQILDYSI